MNKHHLTHLTTNFFFRRLQVWKVLFFPQQCCLQVVIFMPAFGLGWDQIASFPQIIFGVKIPNIFKTTTQPVYSLTSLINSDQSRRSSQLREEAGKLGLEFYCLDFSKQISRELLHEPVTILFLKKTLFFFVVPGFKKTSPSKKKYWKTSVKKSLWHLETPVELRKTSSSTIPSYNLVDSGDDSL